MSFLNVKFAVAKLAKSSLLKGVKGTQLRWPEYLADLLFNWLRVLRGEAQPIRALFFLFVTEGQFINKYAELENSRPYHTYK